MLLLSAARNMRREITFCFVVQSFMARFQRPGCPDKIKCLPCLFEHYKS